MFLHKRLQKHRYLQYFYNIAMIFFSKPNLQKHRKLQCFAPCREGKKGLKTVPKPSKFDSFPAPWFLVEFVPIFTVFFPLPMSPKNALSPPNFKIFIDFHKTQFLDRSSCKNGSKCRRERRFFEPNAKNTVRGRVGARGATRGSKLGLSTLMARLRRI